MMAEGYRIRPEDAKALVRTHRQVASTPMHQRNPGGRVEPASWRRSHVTVPIVNKTGADLDVFSVVRIAPKSSDVAELTDDATVFTSFKQWEALPPDESLTGIYAVLQTPANVEQVGQAIVSGVTKVKLIDDGYYPNADYASPVADSFEHMAVDPAGRYPILTIESPGAFQSWGYIMLGENLGAVPEKTCLIYNTTGNDIDKYSIWRIDTLGYGPGSFDTDDLTNPQIFKVALPNYNEGQYPAFTYDDGYRIVVALEDIPNGSIGRAAHSGVVPVKIQISTLGVDHYCRVTNLDSSKMTCQEYGYFKVVWKEASSVGTHWALVSLDRAYLPHFFEFRFGDASDAPASRDGMDDSIIFALGADNGISLAAGSYFSSANHICDVKISLPSASQDGELLYYDSTEGEYVALDQPSPGYHVLCFDPSNSAPEWANGYIYFVNYIYNVSTLYIEANVDGGAGPMSIDETSSGSSPNKTARVRVIHDKLYGTGETWTISAGDQITVDDYGHITDIT